MDFAKTVRSIPDYPKPGIVFRDITTLLGNARAFRSAVDALVQPYAGVRIDKVAGIEARGFILGGAVAHQLSVGFVPVRKKGKLPYATHEQSYDLEYGSNTVAIHIDAVKPGERVLLVDDTRADLDAGAQLALDAALLLDEQRTDAARPLAQSLDAGEHAGEVAVPVGATECTHTTVRTDDPQTRSDTATLHRERGVHEAGTEHRIDTGRTEVGRGGFELVDDLCRRERRMCGHDECCGRRHERSCHRRTAGPGVRVVGIAPVGEHVHAGCGDVDVAAGLRETCVLEVVVDRRDRHRLGVGPRVDDRVALRAVVAGGGDHDESRFLSVFAELPSTCSFRRHDEKIYVNSATVILLNSNFSQ